MNPIIEIINPSLKSYSNDIYDMSGEEILERLGYKKNKLTDFYKLYVYPSNKTEALCFMLYIMEDSIDKRVARYKINEGVLDLEDISKADLSFAEIIAVYKIIKDKGCIIDF